MHVSGFSQDGTRSWREMLDSHSVMGNDSWTRANTRREADALRYESNLDGVQHYRAWIPFQNYESKIWRGV